MKVLLVPNFSREVAVSGARKLEEWLFEQGCDVQWAHDKKLFPDKVIDCSDCQLVISLGGDGTLLRAAKIVEYSEIPILGISYGHLGFLTSATPHQMIEMVADALAGELHVSRRATLAIETEYELPSGETYAEKTFSPRVLVHVCGMRMVNLDNFAGALDDPHQKQLRWAAIKQVPPLGEPY